MRKGVTHEPLADCGAVAPAPRSAPAARPPAENPRHENARLPAQPCASPLLYAIFGGMWILLSDRLLLALARRSPRPDPVADLEGLGLRRGQRGSHLHHRASGTACPDPRRGGAAGQHGPPQRTLPGFAGGPDRDGLLGRAHARGGNARPRHRGSEAVLPGSSRGSACLRRSGPREGPEPRRPDSLRRAQRTGVAQRPAAGAGRGAVRGAPGTVARGGGGNDSPWSSKCRCAP